MFLLRGQKPRWACCRVADPPADYGDHRSWGLWMGGRRLDCRSGPCGDPARSPASSWRVLQACHVVDLRLAQESLLWNFGVGGRSRPPALHCDQIPGLRSGVSVAEVRRSCRRSRRTRRAFPGLAPWRVVRHRSRPSGVLALLRFLANERSRRRRKPLCRPTKTVRTGESDQVSSPGKREFRRRAGRWLQKKRRNRGREQA